MNAKLDPENHEVRRRLFWTIFVLDQFLAVSQGRTTSFREVEPEADLPTIHNEDPNDIEEIELIQNAVEYIKLVKIDHQALILTRKFLTKVITPEETIPQALFLHQAMLAWKADLPPRLQLAPNMSPHTPFVGVLHILYHACAIMIQRCYCNDPSVSHLDIASTARETCSASATSITIITDDIYTNYGIVPMSYPIRGCYFIIYCLIAAATIQVTDIRRGVNGPIMFKRSLALLGNFLRQSTAVDIEREVEILKSSMDTAMEEAPSLMSASSPLSDQRPLKHILPMSQKYGLKNLGGPLPIRPRKISPLKASGLSPNDATLTGSFSDGTSTLTAIDASNFSTSTTGTTGEATGRDQSVPSSAASKESSQSPQLEDDLDVNVKSSPSSVTSKPFSSNDKSPSSSETLLQSVPTFTAPASLPSDFNAFAQAQQQAVAGNQAPPPFMSITQFLTYQQEHQRMMLQKQQMTTAQIQEQFRLQVQQQQQLSQDPAVYNTFLNNFSNLNNYQQLNSDQAQNELLTMLNSTVLGYGDNSGFGASGGTDANSTLYQQRNLSQSTEQQDALSSSLSPCSTTISSSAFSPELDHLGANFFFSQGTMHQQQDRQRTSSLDESLISDAILTRNQLQDTPSPESFPILDMTSSIPSYIGTDNTVPLGIRQALGDVSEILKFQAQTGLTDE